MFLALRFALTSASRVWVPTALVVVFAVLPVSTWAKGAAAINKYGIQVKVITNRDCKIYAEPDASSKGEPCPVFKYWYVLPPEKNSPTLRVEEFKELTKNGFYRVASGDSEKEFRGWLQASDAIEWHHREAVQFSARKGRSLARFFLKNDDLLRDLKKEPVEAQFQEPESSGGARIIIPLLDAKPHTINAEKNQVFQVAFMSGRTISEDDSGDDGGSDKETVTIRTKEGVVPLTKEVVLRDSTADVVFVVDTTASMEDPIAQVLKSIGSAAETLIASPDVKDTKLRFGLVAYRDRIADMKQLEYVTRVVCTLDEGEKHGTFQARLKDLKVAQVSSEDYAEDVLAGIWAAADVNALKWNPVAWKQLIIVGDSSIKEANHPNSRSRENEDNRTIAQVLARLQPGSGEIQEALISNFVTSVVHVLQDDAKPDHPIAESQYLQLVAGREFNGDYYKVREGEDFSAKLAADLVKKVKRLSEFKRSGGTAPAPAVVKADAAGADAGAPAAAAAGSGSKKDPAGAPAAGEESSASYPYPLLPLIGKLPADDSGRNPNLMSFRSAYCSEYDASGDILFETYVFTRRGTLSIFQSILGVMKNALQDAGPTGGRNVEAVVDVMKTTAAALFSGETKLDKDTPPEVLIQQLLGFPVRTPLLKKTFAEIAAMPQADYEDWVKGIDAQVQSLQALIDNSAIWFKLHAGAEEREKHAFIPLTDFP